MGRFSKNLGSLADEIVTECEFVSLDQKRRVKALRAMWDTGSNATILSTALIRELSPESFVPSLVVYASRGVCMARILP